MKCVFGDWDCPVADRLEEMQRELIASMRIKPPKLELSPEIVIAPHPIEEMVFDDLMVKMMGALASPLNSLANFCQACPIVKHQYKLSMKIEVNDK